MNNDIIFHQLFEKETSSYTYIIGDPVSKEAIIIDPVIEMVDRDLNLIKEQGLKLKYILDTHVHADHITGSGILRKRTGAKIALSSSYDMSCADLHLEDGQELFFGSKSVKVISTPGHTNGCLTYQVEEMIFTGDVLLVRGCGRTDFQEGSSEKLFTSVRERLFILPDNTTIFPAHDYKGFTKTTIQEEKKHNPRLNLTIIMAEFATIMGNLKLAEPKKIKEAVPANLQCGLPTTSVILDASFINGVPSLTAEDLLGKLGHMRVIDVRGNDEFNNELGHIPNAQLATLGVELEEKLLDEDKDRDIIFVCRSGKRSLEATKVALNNGFKKVYNLQGGMLRWKELSYPSEKDLAGS